MNCGRNPIIFVPCVVQTSCKIVRTGDPAEAFEAAQKLQDLPKNSNPIRMHNRCKLTGRPKGDIRQFGISRIQFREMASNGLIPGDVYKRQTYICRLVM